MLNTKGIVDLFLFFLQKYSLMISLNFLKIKFECIYDKFTQYTQISLYHTVVKFVIIVFLYFVFFMNCSFIFQ